MQFGLDLEIVRADRDMVTLQPLTNEGTRWVQALLGPQSAPTVWGAEDILALQSLVLESSLRFKVVFH